MNLPTAFTEDLRYLYPLTPSSLVIDCGGYHGTFARTITERYNCHVIVFEPVRQFFDQLTSHLANGLSAKLITLIHAGVGPRTELVNFTIKGDMTGRYADDGGRQQVQLLNFVDFLTAIPQPIDLLKLNIEGGEYDLLDAMLDAGSLTGIRNLQVQFHRIQPDSEARHAAIRSRLLTTHHLTYDFPFCWSNFALNP
jgi:FkbM family methyltransferase